MRHLSDDIGHRAFGFQGREMSLGRCQQRPDIGSPKGRDPVDHRGLKILPNPPGGDHLSITEQGGMVHTKAVADLPDLCGEGGRVCSVALKDLDGDWAPSDAHNTL